MDNKNVTKYKKALGKAGENLTDDQIQSCAITMRQLAEILIEEYIKTKNG